MNDELRKEIIKWLKRYEDTIEKQSNKEAHIISRGMTADQIMNLISAQDTAIRIDELERLDAQFPDFRETGQTTYTIEDIEKFSKYFIDRLASLRGKGEAE